MPRDIYLPPYPQQPAAFEPDPEVVGDPTLSRLVKLIVDRDPKLRRLISKVQIGPTAGVIEKGNYRGMGIDPNTAFPRGLNATTRLRTGEIALNPDLTHNPSTSRYRQTAGGDHEPASILRSLFHEIAHLKGADEPGAVQAADALSPEMHNTLVRKAMQSPQ